jgi:Cu2+-containing amine oxidase
MAFPVDAQDQAPGDQAHVPHPLAPLTAAEIEAAASAVKAAASLADTARFVYISLHEPPKHEVIAFEQGKQEAMRKRGIEDFSLCMIDAWSTPNVEPNVGPADGRFVSPLTWLRDDPDDNGYARQGLPEFAAVPVSLSRRPS